MQLLKNVSPDVDTVLFMNHEGIPETDTVEDRFREVTLFKPAKRFSPKVGSGFEEFVSTHADAYINSYLQMQDKPYEYDYPVPHHNLYANGKSAARVTRKLRPSGPHEFSGHQAKSNDSAILHYAYSRFEDVSEKPLRSCPHLQQAAINGDKKALDTCFVLPFDIDVYVAAATKNETELRRWFQSKVMKHSTLYGFKPDKLINNTYEDARVRKEVVDTLVKQGGLKRILGPQLVLTTLDTAMQAYWKDQT
eukprot:scaffold1328_cov394-Prasinococcus_capsulatus_cf.AAC.24